MVIPEESMVQLNELPEKWANTKRLSVQAKQQVSPLQSLEVCKLKNRISDFEKKQVSCLFTFGCLLLLCLTDFVYFCLLCLQAEFRKSFTAMRFHKFKCRRPYELLAEANKMIDVLEVDMRTLQDQCLGMKINGLLVAMIYRMVQ